MNNNATLFGLGRRAEPPPDPRQKLCARLDALVFDQDGLRVELSRAALAKWLAMPDATRKAVIERLDELEDDDGAPIARWVAELLVSLRVEAWP